MVIEYSTATSSVAETLNHQVGAAAQTVIGALEIALISDRDGPLDEVSRKNVDLALSQATETIRDAIALAEAAGRQLKGLDASALHIAPALDVIIADNVSRNIQ
jgi:hypothetical protein